MDEKARNALRNQHSGLFRMSRKIQRGTWTPTNSVGILVGIYSC